MTPADWYPDPADPTLLRWWDGTQWTSHTSPAGPAAPAAFETHLTRIGDKVVVPSSALMAGLAPDRCSPHGRRGSTAKIDFTSRTPMWVYLTLVTGLLIPIIIGLVLRKRVSATAWPICDECVAERRKRLLLMWAAIASWLPLLLLVSVVSPALPDVAGLLLLVVAVVGPVVVAIWFADRAGYARAVGGVVAADGMTVAFPASAFAATTSVAAVTDAVGTRTASAGAISTRTISRGAISTGAMSTGAVAGGIASGTTGRHTRTTFLPEA